MSESRKIYVYLDWEFTIEPILIGTLMCTPVRGHEVFSFTSSDEWLRHNDFRVLDPDLGQFSGRQYLQDEKPNFGLFLDSSPDRWGRLLIKRKEALMARLENRPRTQMGTFAGLRHKP